MKSKIFGAYELFCEFVRKDFGRVDDLHIKAIKAILSLFLSLATQLRILVDDSTDLKEAYDEEANLAINKLYIQLRSFFVKTYGLSFGGCDYIFYEYNSKAELKVYYMHFLFLRSWYLFNYI